MKDIAKDEEKQKQKEKMTEERSAQVCLLELFYEWTQTKTVTFNTYLFSHVFFNV